jgi:hypothetical protein
VKGKCQFEGGPHWLTLEAAKFTATSHGIIYVISSSRSFSSLDYKLLRFQGKKWHPTAGMHLMRGEVLAYRYAYILLDAIFKVEEDLQKRSASDLRSGRRNHINILAFFEMILIVIFVLNDIAYKAELDFLQPPLGDPTFCDKVCESRPICYTDFEPNYNPEKKLSKVLLLPARDSADSPRWNRVQFKKDTTDDAKYGWLDRRPLYESSGINATIYVQLRVSILFLPLSSSLILYSIGENAYNRPGLWLSCERFPSLCDLLSRPERYSSGRKHI